MGNKNDGGENSKHLSGEGGNGEKEKRETIQFPDPNKPLESEKPEPNGERGRRGGTTSPQSTRCLTNRLGVWRKAVTSGWPGAGRPWHSGHLPLCALNFGTFKNSENFYS